MVQLQIRGIRIALLTLVFFVLGAVAAGAAAFYFLVLFDLPNIQSLDDFKPALSSRILDRKGRPIGEFFEERRQLIATEEVPKHVINAFVAGEDAAFFSHTGLDYVSIFRAAVKNLVSKIEPGSGGRMQGGSTITQQVAKSFISPERTLRRKLKDMMLARRLEKNLTKQEILYLYLNQIFFGQGYGIVEAARQYFGKSVQELTVSEAALLAGLPKAPSAYSPYANPKAAEMRRLYVLTEMRNNKFIDEATYQEAVASPPVLHRPKELEDYAYAAYFTEEIRRDLLRRLGNDTILRGGLKIETTLDIELQRAAVKAVRAGLSDLDHRRGYRGPLRHVEAKAIAMELANLAVENGLVPKEEAQGEAAATNPSSDDEDAKENSKAKRKNAKNAKAADAQATAAEIAKLEKQFPPERIFVGVITKLAPETATATVSFAPGLSGNVLLGDVAWARRDQKPGVASSIEKVFQVGDVAKFKRVVPKSSSQKPDEKLALEDLRRFTLFQEPKVEGALLSIDVASGDVLALVGGYDFERSEFNRATQARRQPGSSFKPIVYSAAISKNFTPASILVDRPYIYKDEYTGSVWRPKGYTGEFLGRMLLREAIAKSVNNVAIHLLNDVGLDYTIAHARKLGIEAPLVHNMALALGSSDLSLLELTRAYLVFPSGGKFKPLHYVVRVTDRNGKVLMDDLTLGNDPELGAAEKSKASTAAKPAAKEGAAPSVALDAQSALPKGAVLPATDAFLMIDLLRAVVSEGTATKALSLGYQADGKPMVAGKTGTTNDQADAWFMGFSPNITTGVWVGFDEKTLLGPGETGSRAALPIWTDYMAVALKKYPPGNFVMPDGIVFARIDRETGMLASSKTQRSVSLPFRAGTEPTEASSLQQKTDASEVLRDELF